MSTFEGQGHCRYFGGSLHWETYQDDVKDIAPDNLANFVAVLFVGATIDQVMYKYFPNRHKTFASHLSDIKFGHSHGAEGGRLNPVRSIVDVAQKEGAFDGVGEGFVGEWARFLTDQVRRLNAADPAIDPSTFIESLLSDVSLQPAHDTNRNLFDVLVREIKAQKLN